METLDSKKAIILNNITCPYCGCKLDQMNTTKEHVIGRRFVPKGSLENTWNLILNACRNCNNFKSDLEDDISVITQITSDTTTLNSEELKSLRNKANCSISRRTGKKIIESQEFLSIPIRLSPCVNLTFNFSCNPQIDNDRESLLAQLHLMAIFYFMTYDKNIRIGHYWQGAFRCIKTAPKTDWGNNINKAFQQLVSTWEVRFHGNTANGNFRCQIRKPENGLCWSWALEWNKNYRLIGFFGNENIYERYINNIVGVDNKNLILKNEKESIYMQREVSIKSDDTLFNFEQ